MKLLSGIPLRASNRRQELDGNPSLTVTKQLDANDLADVFAVVAVRWKVIGKRNEETHALFISLPVS